MKIKEGSRVCCLGDSITDMGFWIYDINGYLADIGSKTRFYNCGIGGNMSSDAPYYLEDEVLKLDPDYVIVMFGANDIGQYLYEKRPAGEEISENEKKNDILKWRKKYEMNMRIICQMLMQRGVEVILMTPLPFDDYERQVTRGVMYGASDELKYYGDLVRSAARELGTGVIELHKQFKSVEDYFEKDGVRLYEDDRVHPNENGFKIMASIVLKYLEYDVEIPKSGEELNKLPFRKTEKNDERFETEKKVRELSLLEYGIYKYESRKRYYSSWEEVAEDIIRRCFEGDFATPEITELYKQRIRRFTLNRPKKEELKRLLIKQTEEL